VFLLLLLLLRLPDCGVLCSFLQLPKAASQHMKPAWLLLLGPELLCG
jgi:hypothetical protein